MSWGNYDDWKLATPEEDAEYFEELERRQAEEEEWADLMEDEHRLEEREQDSSSENE
jgi:hypothetical protein